MAINQALLQSLPFGVPPQDWDVVYLRDVTAKIGSGATPRGGEKVYVNEGVSLIRSQNIYDHEFKDEGLVYIDGIVAEQLSGVTVQVGDVLLNITGDSIARCCIVPERVLPARVNQHVSIIRPSNKLDSVYLQKYISHPKVKAYMLGYDAGGTRKALTKGHIESFLLPLPPLSEQRAISHILGTLDNKIDLNRRMNETLEAMVRSLFKSWFVDFDPVQARAANRRISCMNGDVLALFPSSFVESPLGLIPQGWNIGRFDEEIDFLEGPGLRNWQYSEEGMKFLNIRCIVNGDLDIPKANCIKVEEFHEKYSHFALQKDDIVISTSGTLGRLAIVREDHLPVMLNTSIIRMRRRQTFGLGFVWAFLQSPYFLEEMFAMASGSVQLNFGPIHLRRIKILRPPDEILQMFEATVSPLLRTVLKNRQQSHTLTTLRDTLLSKMISGDIRVKELQ